MPLASQFARRMAPLALAGGVSLAFVPPATYWWISRQTLAQQATTYAETMASGIREEALRSPQLWRYNTSKILLATMPLGRQRDIASVRISDCSNQVLFQQGDETHDDDLIGGAWVESALGRVARVQVYIASHTLWRSVGLVAAISIPLGLLLTLILYVYPTRVVRRQSRRLLETNRDLLEARDAVESVNRDLHERVKAGVSRIKALSRRLLQGQEDDRDRIARELHDSVGQAMTALRFELDLAAEQRNEPILRNASEHLGDIVEDLRRIVHDVRPPGLNAATLVPTLRDFAEKFEKRTGISTYFKAEGANLPNDAVSLCLFRLSQECFHNILKHAQANEVSVRLYLDERATRMEINDDGIGFRPDKVRRGMGITGMKERCALLEGRAEVETHHDRGTRWKFILPTQSEGA